MDVKYIPSDWENAKKGIGNLIGLGAWGKGMIDSLKDISENLEDAQSAIAKYDVDGAISFSHTGHKGVYQGLYEDFKVLHDFAGKVGDIVDRTIDEPFYKDIDAFVSAMEGLSIAGIKTKNRIGAKETVVIPGEYGSNKMEVAKAEVSLEDLFSGSNAYAKQMKEEYDKWKLQNPDQELSEKDYEQAVLHSRAFQYDSIRDGQEKKEFWGQIASLAVVVGTSIICPPAALALGIAYGTLELESAVTGKDWISGRELGTGERVFRGVLAPLDIVPGVSGLSKFSSTVRLAHMGDLAELGLKTGIKAGIQRESRHVANMVIDAGKDSAARIRSAKAWAKEVPGRLKRTTEDKQLKRRKVDETAKNDNEILPGRKMGLGNDNTSVEYSQTDDRWTILSKENEEKVVEKEIQGGIFSNDSILNTYSTKIDEQVDEIEKIELPEWIADSFLDGYYRTVVTKEEITVYRVFGGQSEAGGGFVSTTRSKSRIDAKIDLALLPEWKGTRMYEAEIEIPKGQVLNIGKVAPQVIKETGTVLKGRADQILLPMGWPLNWIKKIRIVPIK